MMAGLFHIFTQKLSIRVSATLVGAAYLQPQSQVEDVMNLLGCEPPMEILRKDGDLTEREAIDKFIEIMKLPKKELMLWNGTGTKPVNVISNIEQIHDFIQREGNEKTLQEVLELAQAELNTSRKEVQR
jgi:hypothetical protein